MRQNDTLSTRQSKFLANLLSGMSIEEAAREAKISHATAHRWLKDPIFQEEFKQTRQSLLDQSFTGLQLRFDKAVKALDRHIEEETHSLPKDQIEAAKTIIDKTIQTAQLTERIKDLETQLALKEQESQDHLVLNARLLTKDERDTIEAIIDRVIARNAVVIDGANATQ